MGDLPTSFISIITSGHCIKADSGSGLRKTLMISVNFLCPLIVNFKALLCFANDVVD